MPNGHDGGRGQELDRGQQKNGRGQGGAEKSTSPGRGKSKGKSKGQSTDDEANLAQEILTALREAEQTKGSLLQALIQIVTKFAGEDKTIGQRGNENPKGKGEGGAKGGKAKDKETKSDEVCGEIDKTRYPEDSLGDAQQINSALSLGNDVVEKIVAASATQYEEILPLAEAVGKPMCLTLALTDFEEDEQYPRKTTRWR